jgi:hypothetical protein
MERDAGPTLSRGLTPPSSPPPRPAGAAGTTAAEEDTVLIVDPEDPLVPWDLVDASGNTTAHAGARRLVLKPGLYTVRTTTPEGAVSEALLDLERGESERVAVRLPAPSRAMEQLAGRTGFGMLRDDSQRVELSEALGPVANVTLSTTLALAARVATFGLDPGFGRKLRAMNLAPSTPVLAGGTGIMVVFAAEQSADAEHAYTAVEELEGVRIAWWNTGTQPPAERQQIDIRGDFPAIGQWMTPSPPGHG